MNIYPAIDLYEGKVVRLERGEFQKQTVYSTKPAEIAVRWEKGGAPWIHIVDLEGAKPGVLKNLPSLFDIRKSVKCRIQFGGGLRTAEDLEQVLGAGIDRVVLGTKALDLTFFEKILKRFGRQVAVGLDVRDGFVQTQGWLNASQATLVGALDFFNHYPLETVIYTDIQKDGMLQGPNFSELQNVLKAAKPRVILSGGVGVLEDIKKAARILDKNFEGVIIGKALYENKFSIEQAIHESLRASA